MNQSFRLIDCNVSLAERSKRKRKEPIDWSLCVLCQTLKPDEEIRDPSLNKRPKKDEGYDLLAKNLPEFHRLGRMPCTADIDLLGGENGILATLTAHKAKWHSSCYLKCSNSKLRRFTESVGQENLPPTTPSPVSTRRSVGLSQADGPMCIICGLNGTSRNKLHECVAKEKLKERAGQRGDSKVLVQLQSGTVMYHKGCMTTYMYEKKKSVPATTTPHAKCLAGVADFITDVKRTSPTSELPVFKMTDIARMYASDLEAEGVVSTQNTTILRKKILEKCPSLECSGSVGQNSLIRFKSDVDCAVRSECAQKEENCALKCLKKVRDEIFEHPPTDWSELSQNVAQNCVPSSLTNVVSMLVDGVELGADEEPDTIVSTIAQLIFYNSRKRQRGKGSTRRHDASRETPTLVYLACKVWGQTRSKELVDLTYTLGLSISYDRLQTILTDRANRAARQYQADKVVCPINLNLKCFTTGQIDNIDKDTSSATAKDSFHGTAISLLQHGPEGEKRHILADSERQRKILDLPIEYSVVPPLLMEQKAARCPAGGPTRPDPSDETEPILLESEWLDDCRNPVSVNTWSGHHALSSRPREHKTRFAILPLFREKAASLAMMAHGMSSIMAATKLLNHTQVPVVVADQQLYTICKFLQWLKPNELGEDKVFVMMGGMHIELAALRTLGDWLEGSGWTSALAQAGITTPGRADAILSVNNLDRARYTHQVGAAVLYSLKKRAYENFACDDPISYEEWCRERRSTPQFRYWDIVLEMQLICFQMVSAMRNPNFELYNMALTRFAHYFFSLDHQNYARWLPVHIRDNHNLKSLHPSLWEKFDKGYFVAQKTLRDFSGMPLDQAHEQLNALLKGDGGFNGLTENPVALLKFMLTAPEAAEITDKFQTNILKRIPEEGGKHHLDNDRSKSHFYRDIMALEEFFEKAGNPFAEESHDLYNIDTRRCCPKEVVETVMRMEEVGKSQYDAFCSERLEKGSVSIHTPIKRNNFPTFAKGQKAKGAAEKSKLEIKNLQENLNVMNRMWVASLSSRPVNPKEFNSREISKYPPALALPNGNPRTADNKADLWKDCLADLVTTRPQDAPHPKVDVKVFDGAVLMYILKPSTTCSLFSHFRDNVFYQYMKEEAKNVSRIDIVWDVYWKDSIKNATRQKRGEGIRTRVAHDTKIPQRWSEFMRDPDNKTELFQLLAEGIPKTGNVDWYSTLGTGVVSSTSRDLSGVAPCNHEEADTRLFVHVADAVSEGRTRVMVCSSDTDIIVLACSAFQQLGGAITELWIRRCANKFIAVHELCNALGPQKCLALPAFHAFTGCDSVEIMSGIGKKKGWNALSLVPEAAQALIQLSEGKVDESREKLHRFVIAMYSLGKTFDSLNDCRGKLLVLRKQHEKAPPTEDTMELRIRRASFQAQVWRQLFQPWQDLPSPGDWGWVLKENIWVHKWTTLPSNTVDNITTTSCGCKVACAGNCKCNKNGVDCVEGLCSCVCFK